MDLWLALERSAAAHPAKEAIVDEQRRLTYSDLVAESRRCAAGLQKLGVTAGDRVLIVAENSWRHAVCLLACQSLHAMSVHVAPRIKDAEARYFVEDAEPRVVLTSVDLPEVKVPVLRLDESGWSALTAGDDVTLPDPDASAWSHMVYTSGTTGQPKGVPMSHHQTYERSLSTAIQIGLYHDDRVLGAMPLFHAMGVTGGFMVAIVLGATWVPVPRFTPDGVLALIERERVTAFFGSPTHYALLAASPALSTADLSSFNRPVYGGAPMSPEQISFWHERLNRPLTHIYGSTETMCTLVNRDAVGKPTSNGRPGFHHWLRVVEIGTRDPNALVAAGTEGELVVRVEGPGSSDEGFSQYWRKPDRYLDAVVAGWYFTGDSARVDASGDWQITGRIKNLIRSGAESIHPEEVEAVLLKHPRVKDVGVVGVPDPVWEEVVGAVVVPDGPLSAEDVDSFCRQEPGFADFKRPRKIVFVDAVPRNVSGKLIRGDALAILAPQVEAGA